MSTLTYSLLRSLDTLTRDGVVGTLDVDTHITTQMAVGVGPAHGTTHVNRGVKGLESEV